MWKLGLFWDDCGDGNAVVTNTKDFTRRVEIVFWFLWHGTEIVFHIKSYQTIILSSNYSGERSLYLAGRGVCAAESTMSHFLRSLVFQMEEINCMGPWNAPFCFGSKQTSQLFLRLQRTHYSISRRIVGISRLSSQTSLCSRWRRLKGFFLSGITLTHLQWKSEVPWLFSLWKNGAANSWRRRETICFSECVSLVFLRASEHLLFTQGCLHCINSTSTICRCNR